MLVVVNVPARLMAKPLEDQSWPLAVFAIVRGRGVAVGFAVDVSPRHAQLSQRQQLRPLRHFGC